jgi:hypothetical protein
MRYSKADQFLSIIIGCLLLIIATRYSTASFLVLFLIVRANQALLSSAELLPSGYMALDAQLFLLSPGNSTV